MIRSRLCDYSDAYTFTKETIKDDKRDKKSNI